MTYYASYLLRLRWSFQVDEWICQIVLVSVMTSEHLYFADLESLLAFLHQQHAAKKEETQEWNKRE